LNVPRLIDPKIFKINHELFVTFNSGWIREGNDLFIMKVYPEFESPKRVVYKNRQKQERNWAFFSRDNDIYALYWINSLKILRLTDKDGACWEFEDYSSEETLNNKLPSDLTIGTQLSELEGKYYFIAHKKYFSRLLSLF